MHSRILVEVCAGGIDDCLLAAELNADRIELNSGMPSGGLTPSIALMQHARRAFAGPIVAMLRPREGGFCYSAAEFQLMLSDAEQLISAGADGLACGVLSADGSLDEARAEQLRTKFPNIRLVFHRAFDVTPDQTDVLNRLADLEFDCVLTSGASPTATQGAIRLAEIQQIATGRIEILPAGGIRAGNVRFLVKQTNCNQVHASCRMQQTDTSTNANPAVSFGSCNAVANGSFGICDRGELAALLQAARFADECRDSADMNAGRGSWS